MNNQDRGRVFSYIKAKTKVFSTANNKPMLPDDFLRIFADKNPSYDYSALRRVALSRIQELGLDGFLRKAGIVLPRSVYAKLADQFNHVKGTGIFVEPIHKIKGLESDTVYFVICNSLLEILLGAKNDYNKETNLLYVALTRTKRRLLLVVDDDEGLKANFEKQEIDINTELCELGIKKAVIENWF